MEEAQSLTHTCGMGIKMPHGFTSGSTYGPGVSPGIGGPWDVRGLPVTQVLGALNAEGRTSRTAFLPVGHSSEDGSLNTDLTSAENDFSFT